MTRVLIIDEIIASCKKTLAALTQEFECLSHKTIDDALKSVNEFKPDIILLDMNIQDMEGIKTCKKFSTLECGKKSFIVVVADTSNIDTKIKAYDAGVYDFISVPFSIEELIKKLQNIAKVIIERNDLQHSIDDTQSLAMASMKQASHYGYIMNFFKNLFHSTSVDEVAVLFFDAMQYWNLNASLAIRLDKIYYYDSAVMRTISPIERKIYVALSEAGRLYEFGQRMIVNDKHVSFLVKNMPSDPNFSGEVRDIVAAIIEGLEAKVVDLKRQKGLDLVTKELTDTIVNVKRGVTTHNQLISSVITDMMGAVSSSFHSLDLTEPQEAFFHELFEKSGTKIMSVEQVLLDIEEQLSLLSNQVDIIIEDTKEPVKNHSNTELELF